MYYTCKKGWITPDGRIAFISGQRYPKARTSGLAVVGENGIVIFMSETKFKEYFV